MASFSVFDCLNTVVWRIDDFAAKYQQSIAGDEMISDPFAFEHPKFGKIGFHLGFWPKTTIDATTPSYLWMQIMEAPSVFLFSLECSAWMEAEDGNRSEVESERSLFDEEHVVGHWTTFLSSRQRAEFIDLSTVYICCRLPYPVKPLGMTSTKNTFYQWTIDNFDSRFNSAQFKTLCKSDTFNVPEFNDVKFALKFCPKGDNEEHKDYCAFYLHIKDLAGHSKVSFQSDLWIKNSEEQLHKISDNYVLSTNHDVGSSCYAEQAELCEFAQNGPFDICCNIRPIIDTSLCLDCVSSRTEIAPFFNDPYFSDAEIHVDNRIFKVSRLMISIKSPVFRAMFDKETKEQKSGVVTISGFEATMVEKLLIYIYKGEIVDLVEIAVRLLPIADCYQVNDLVKKCCDSILSNLIVKKVLPVLELAYERDHLKEFYDCVFEFAHKNYGAIRELDGSEDFFTEHPKIAMKLLSAFYSSG
ncbi:Speckle-type POZ protein A isoform X1 [Aphelenchoides besseyi]|nr:Speckle-type POZ protein A isoform X1 [Aphelenchoides besseyi]